MSMTLSYDNAMTTIAQDVLYMQKMNDDYDKQARKIAAGLEINLSEKVRLALTTEGGTP